MTDRPGHTLPRLLCPEREFGELTADAAAAPWRDLAGAPFFENVTGHPPKQGTQVRAARDAAELRLLFVADDIEPWATLTERDASLYTEEVVEVFLDPVGDLGAYFEIEVNPLNTVLDLVIRRIRNGYRKDFAWQCDGLRTKVRIGQGQWTTEIAIPFASVALEPPKAGDVWRANFTRIDRPRGEPRELSAWSPTGYALFHIPPKFGELVFA